MNHSIIDSQLKSKSNSNSNPTSTSTSLTSEITASNPTGEDSLASSSSNPSIASVDHKEEESELLQGSQETPVSSESQDSIDSSVSSITSTTSDTSIENSIDNKSVSASESLTSSSSPITSATSSTSTKTSTASTNSNSKPGKKHRTVRSLTRQYESDSNQNNNKKQLSFQPFPSPSHSPTSLSPTTGNPSSSSSPTSTSSSSSTTNTHHSHSRRPSVLLASASYPSTLSTDPTRSRTISSSSSLRSNSDKRIRTTSTTSTSSSNRTNSASPSNKKLNLPSIQPNSNTNTQTTPTPTPTTETSPSPVTMTSLPTLSISQENNESNLNQIHENGDHHHHHHDHHHHEKETSSSSSSSTSTTGTSLKPSTHQDEDDEQEEELDSITELNKSTSSVGKKGQDSNSTGGSGGKGKEKEKGSDEMSASERRDHSRKHSRVHSRNLSVFFPRPGTEAEIENDLERAKENFGNHNSSSHLSIDTTVLENKDGKSSNQSSSTSNNNNLNVPNSSNGIGNISPTQSRRGHHHKHSVQFSSNQTLSSPLSPNQDHSSDDQLDHFNSPVGKLHSPSTPTTSHSHSHHSHSNHDHSHNHHDHSHQSISPLNYSKAYSTTTDHYNSNSDSIFSSIPYLKTIPKNLIPSLIFGSLHFLLGSSLWVSGQSNDSLSVTGLGYLVVFDSFGILSLVFSEWNLFGGRNEGLEDNRGEMIRKPYSSHRLSVLLHFTQSIYLLFAAVYVCKESVEHALLEGSDSEEHAHSISHKESDGIVLPWFLLLLATVFCVASNVIFGNHAKLVAACGISTTSSTTPIRGHGRQNSILTSSNNLAGPFQNLLSNPFSLTVFFFCSTLLFASLTMPPFQASALDKVLAGMESAAMAYVSYPASKALGKVLLQTAPEGSESNALNGLKRAVKIIEDHPQVTFVAPPHVWQLTPPTSALSAPLGGVQNLNNSLTPSLSLVSSGSRGPKAAALIATLQIFIKPDSTDSDCLDITRWAWERAAPSIGAGAGLNAGDNLRGSIMAGELIIQVEREGVKEEENLKDPVLHSHSHHDHDHSHHDHSHSHHDHDHSHHDHGHSHHDHSHSHHDHGHSHQDHSNHSHSHDHSSSHQYAHSHHDHSHDHSSHSHSHHSPSTHVHSH